MTELYNQNYCLITFSGINLAVNQANVVNVVQASSVNVDAEQTLVVGQLTHDKESYPAYALDGNLVPTELTQFLASSTFCVLLKNTTSDACFGLIGESVSQLDLRETEVVITQIPDFMKTADIPVKGVCRLGEQTIMIVDAEYFQSFIEKNLNEVGN